MARVVFGPAPCMHCAVPLWYDPGPPRRMVERVVGIKGERSWREHGPPDRGMQRVGEIVEELPPVVPATCPCGGDVSFPYHEETLHHRAHLRAEEGVR